MHIRVSTIVEYDLCVINQYFIRFLLKLSVFLLFFIEIARSEPRTCASSGYSSSISVFDRFWTHSRHLLVNIFSEPDNRKFAFDSSASWRILAAFFTYYQAKDVEKLHFFVENQYLPVYYGIWAIALHLFMHIRVSTIVQYDLCVINQYFIRF